MYELLKRLIDLTVAFIFIVIFLPVYVLIAFLIWMQDKHSPFFVDTRIGKDQVPFKFIKFRSMVKNADDILFKDAKLYQQMRTGANKVKNDPRVTKLGKFIRKYSIDEFPQMINVIKGDMSVVGPRALRPDEYEGYAQRSPDNRVKLETMTTVKPGITGVWQTSGRSNINFDQRIDMDCMYARNKSILMDLVLILKTPLAMIMARGAY